jgi:signal transduction histidine kinase
MKIKDVNVSQTHDDEVDAFAHRLKSPLTIVIGLAEELEVNHSTMPKDELCDCLRSIKRNGRKMNNIIDEFLSYHLINGGKDDSNQSSVLMHRQHGPQSNGRSLSQEIRWRPVRGA